MKLEIGKRYVRRDGRITAPLISHPHPRYKFKDPDTNKTFTKEGEHVQGVKHPANLISEYQEPRYRLEEVRIPLKDARAARARHLEHLEQQIKALCRERNLLSQSKLQRTRTVEVKVLPGEPGYEDASPERTPATYQGDFRWINIPHTAP